LTQEQLFTLKNESGPLFRNEVVDSYCEWKRIQFEIDNLKNDLLLLSNHAKSDSDLLQSAFEGETRQYVINHLQKLVDIYLNRIIIIDAEFVTN